MSSTAVDAAGAAIDRLRRGLPVVVRDGDAAMAMLSVELADSESLAAFDASSLARTPADLLLSGERAATLNLVSQSPAAIPGPVRIERSPWLDLTAALALADPVADLANPLKGPWRALPTGDDARALSAGLRLAKQARLLPALFVRLATPDDDCPAVPVAAIEQYAAPQRLRIAARARLPIAASADSTIVAFRAPGEEGEHLALIVGTPDMSGAPLVRLHSECLTGDLLGSLKCDCGPQLHAALAAMGEAGGGVLLYLRQEGRGIGIVNKLRAYALQDQGFDTVDANLRLGFAVDERDFAVAARMLALLGVSSVRLLSNNPAKIAGLEAEGLKVAERVPLKAGEGAHNRAYLATKRDRTGHIL